MAAVMRTRTVNQWECVHVPTFLSNLLHNHMYKTMMCVKTMSVWLMATLKGSIHVCCSAVFRIVAAESGSHLLSPNPNVGLWEHRDDPKSTITKRRLLL